MTPGARIAAAIEVLDDMVEGLAAEQALTRWARRSRFAGSKDRAAVRDHVFDVLRRRRTAAHLGQGSDGRALMIGILRAQGHDPEMYFSGEGYGPAVLSEVEQEVPPPSPDAATRWELPDWLIPLFQSALGPRAEETAIALQDRAPVTLRVNSLKADANLAQQMLTDAAVTTINNPLAPTALTVTDGARKIRNSAPYLDGAVELQDAASQAVVGALPGGRRVLDYCAGGGGKALALAADPAREVFAHDIDPRRMNDLPQRAARAGATVTLLETTELAEHPPFDIVLCDAPCSGSGAWRRSAEGKWTFTPMRLAELTGIQDSILDDAASLTAPRGTLVYATCSVLSDENEARVDAFLERNPDWQVTFSRRFNVDTHGDGFFTAHLKR